MFPATAVQQHPAKLLTKSFSCCLAVAFLFLIIATGPTPVLASYETPPVLQATSILQPKLLKGKYHRVNEQVKNDGLFNHYPVVSKGKFTRTPKSGAPSSICFLSSVICGVRCQATGLK